MRIDTLLMCAPTHPPPAPWATKMDPTPHHHQEKKIPTARSKLSLLLRRCLTPAPAATGSPKVFRHTAGSSPSLSRKVGMPLLHWTLIREGPRASYPALVITPATRIGTLVKRTRTFYQEAARWDPKEKPSVESIAAAGFYFDGGFIIIII